MSVSTKQQLNARSSTEAELIAVDGVVTKIVWASHFLFGQGFAPGVPTLAQDNKSAILLESKGMESVGKRSRHIDIRYFFIKDLVDRGVVNVEYCPTEQMLADFMTKPLQGAKFLVFREKILGKRGTNPRKGLQKA